MRKSGDNLSRAWLALPAGGAALALGAVLLWRAGGSVDNRLSAATAAGPAETGPAAIERREEESLDLSEIRLPLTDIRPERGLCFIARIPLLSPNERDDRKPGLRLFEDDVELKQAARPHAEIRELAGGRFSHWGPTVFLSSSDGSDPRKNGRRYTIRFTRDSIADQWDWGFTPVAVVPADAIRPGVGHEYVYRLPTVLLGWPSDLETMNGSRLVLLEDGAPLRGAHAMREEVVEEGTGRYAHLGGAVRFSTSDNSDPRTNGRRYVIALGDVSSHRFIDPYAGAPPRMEERLPAPRIEWPREGAVINEARPEMRLAAADPSLLYFWELDVAPTFDTVQLHRRPRVRQGVDGPDLLRVLDREPDFAPEFEAPYRLGVLMEYAQRDGTRERVAATAGRLGFGLPTGDDELREVYEYVHHQIYPVAEDTGIRSVEETGRRDRGFCASMNLFTRALLEDLGYRTRRAQVSIPGSDPRIDKTLYSHSSLEVFCSGRWSIIDPWFGFCLPGVSFQDLADRPPPGKYVAILSVPPPEDVEHAGRRRLLHLSDYAMRRRYDQFDFRFAPYHDEETERLAFSGEPAVVLEPGWRTLWPDTKMNVWVRVRSVNLPPEAIDRWMLPRDDVNDYRPEVIEVSPWTTVSFTIDLAKAYGFDSDE